MSNFGDSELSNIRISLEQIEEYNKGIDNKLGALARTLGEIDSSLRGLNFNLSELQKLAKIKAGLDPLTAVDEQLGK